MDHRDAALELGLHLGIARGRKRQLAKLLVLLAEGTAAQCCGDPGDDYQILRLHGTLRAFSQMRCVAVSAAVQGRSARALGILHPPFGVHPTGWTGEVTRIRLFRPGFRGESPWPSTAAIRSSSSGKSSRTIWPARPSTGSPNDTTSAAT